MDGEGRVLAGALLAAIGFGGIADAHARSCDRDFAPSASNGSVAATPPQSAVTPGGTAWKLYRNDQYGFEIKYPRHWTLEVEIAPAASNFTFTSQRETSGTKVFLVQVNPHLDYATLKGAVDASLPAVKPISETNLLINGYPAIQVIEPPGIGSVIYFYASNTLYGVPGDPTALNDPEIATMLSTFCFIPVTSRGH